MKDARREMRDESRNVQAMHEQGALIKDGRGLLNRRAFINQLGMVAGGVALSVSWSNAVVANSPVGTARETQVTDDDPVFGSPGYADPIGFSAPRQQEQLAMDDPIFNIFVS